MLQLTSPHAAVHCLLRSAQRFMQYLHGGAHVADAHVHAARPDARVRGLLDGSEQRVVAAAGGQRMEGRRRGGMSSRGGRRLGTVAAVAQAPISPPSTDATGSPRVEGDGEGRVDDAPVDLRAKVCTVMCGGRVDGRSQWAVDQTASPGKQAASTVVGQDSTQAACPVQPPPSPHPAS